MGGCAPITESTCINDDCRFQKEIVEDPSLCPMRECFATDCKKCAMQRKCIWTRHVLRSGECFKIIFFFSILVKSEYDSHYSTDATRPLEVYLLTSLCQKCSNTVKLRGRPSSFM